MYKDASEAALRKTVAALFKGVRAEIKNQGVDFDYWLELNDDIALRVKQFGHWAEERFKNK